MGKAADTAALITLWHRRDPSLPGACETYRQKHEPHADRVVVARIPEGKVAVVIERGRHASGWVLA